jgi:formylmethanofuran dehydrogenase subunit D
MAGNIIWEVESQYSKHLSIFIIRLSIYFHKMIIRNGHTGSGFLWQVKFCTIKMQRPDLLLLTDGPGCKIKLKKKKGTIIVWVKCINESID